VAISVWEQGLAPERKTKQQKRPRGVRQKRCLGKGSFPAVGGIGIPERRHENKGYEVCTMVEGDEGRKPGLKATRKNCQEEGRREEIKKSYANLGLSPGEG